GPCRSSLDLCGLDGDDLNIEDQGLAGQGVVAVHDGELLAEAAHPDRRLPGAGPGDELIAYADVLGKRSPRDLTLEHWVAQPESLLRRHGHGFVSPPPHSQHRLEESFDHLPGLGGELDGLSSRRGAERFSAVQPARVVQPYHIAGTYLSHGGLSF